MLLLGMLAPRAGMAMHNIAITVEMLAASIVMVLAFPASQFQRDLEPTVVIGRDSGLAQGGRIGWQKEL